MVKKKIGIATCFLNNYGACLQAFALQSVLEKMDCDAEILQYIEPLGYENDKRILHKITTNKITRKIRSFISSEYRKRYLFRESCMEFKKNYLNLSKDKMYSYNDVKEKTSLYDMFVCGSDQVWNPTFYGNPNRVYYLDFADNKRRIAYAPSIGVSDIDDEYRQEFIRLVKNFDYLSVREKTGSELILKYTGREADVVLDPTLLITGENWKKLINERNIDTHEPIVAGNERYIFCYLFGDRPFYYSFIDQIQKITNLNVCIIPFCKNQERDIYHAIYGAGPLDFISLIMNAELVITDSFHATAFSVNSNTPFYTLLRNADNDKTSMNSRVIDLLSLLNLESRLWVEENEYELFSLEIDWKITNEILRDKREKDLGYIKKALS